MKLSIETITVEAAKELLEKSEGKNYRVLDMNRVRRYSRIMQLDEWELNGQTIQINCDGSVIDGQHRLAAVVHCGKPLKTAVATGVVSDGLHIDRGKARSVSQHLRYLQMPRYSVLASAAPFCLAHANGKWATTTAPSQLFTDDQMVNFVVDNQKRLQDAITVCLPTIKGFPNGVATAMAFVTTPPNQMPSDNEEVEWFWRSLKTGENLEATDPVHLLRERVTQSQTPTRRLNAYYLRMLASVAWNKQCEGVPVKHLRLKLSGPKSQAPPKFLSIAKTT